MEPSPEVDIKEFDEVLKTTDLLVDESVQIYELESEKGNVIDGLYNSLKVITEFLGFSVDLPVNVFNEQDDAKITLTPSLDIVIKRANGKIEQKRLDEFSTKQISKILKNSIMPIIELCKKEKVIQNQNITFLKAVTKKLEKIEKINSENTKSELSLDSSNQDSSNNLNQNMEKQNVLETPKTKETS